MHKFYILLAALVFFQSALKAQETLPSSFIKRYDHLKIDTPIKIAILYRGKFYCLKLDNQLLLFNPENNQVDSAYRDNAKEMGLQNLYLVNDTLIGQSRFSTFYLDNKTAKWMLLKKELQRYPGYPVYEDDKYFVTSTCSGEWGGTIYFKDKKTKEIREAMCTCAVNVIKQNGKFNITASLSHMAGFTNIFDIKNPASLKLHKDNIKPRGYINGKKFYYRGDSESNSKKGTNQLVDSVGITALASIEYQTQIYYLISNDKSVHLDIIQNNKLIELEDLTKLDIDGEYAESRYCSGQRVYTFTNKQHTGFVSIAKNSLSIYSFDWTHK